MSEGGFRGPWSPSRASHIKPLARTADPVAVPVEVVRVAVGHVPQHPGSCETRCLRGRGRPPLRAGMSPTIVGANEIQYAARRLADAPYEARSPNNARMTKIHSQPVTPRPPVFHRIT